jgi:hypothetical protein
MGFVTEAVDASHDTVGMEQRANDATIVTDGRGKRAVSLWDRVNERLGVARKMAADLLDMAEDLSRRGRMKLEIYNLHSDVRDAMAELGGRIYELHVEQGQAETLTDEAVQALFDKVTSLGKAIDQKQKTLDALTAETQAEPAGSGASEA